MKKHHIGSIILLVGILALSSLSFANSEQSSAHYEIKIDDFNSHKVHITMRVALNGGNRLVREIDYIGAYKQMEGLSAYQADGITPATININKEFPFLYGTKLKEWRVSAPGQTHAILKYTVNLGSVPSNAVDKNHKGYVGNGFALFEGGQILLSPSDITTSADAFSITFKVPQGSEIITPWESEGGVYYPNRGLDQELPSSTSGRKLNPWLRLNDTVSIGGFVKLTAKVGNTELLLAVPTTTTEDERKKLLGGIKTQLEFYTKLFKSSVGSRYMIALSPPTHTNYIIWAGEGSFSQGTSLDTRDLSYDMLGHQMFHRWNAWVYGWMDDRSQMGSLFSEGNNRYYEWKSVMNSAQNMIYVSPGRLKRAEDDYRKYKEAYIFEDRIYNTKTDMLAGKNDGWFVYNKGALICMLLDDKMLQDTKGKYGLDEVHRIAFERFGGAKGLLGLNDVLGIIKEVTGNDYSEFFNQYVNGKTPLEMDKFFEDKDRDGLKYYVEQMVGTDPNTFTTGHYRLRKYLEVGSISVVAGDQAETIKNTWHLSKVYSGPDDDHAGTIVWLNNGNPSNISDKSKLVFSNFESMKPSVTKAIEAKEVDGQMFVMIKAPSGELEKMISGESLPSYDSYSNLTPEIKSPEIIPVQKPTITIKPYVASIAAKQASVVLKPKASHVILVNATFSNKITQILKEGLTFASSNKGIVIVDAKGKISAVKKGIAFVTITDSKYGKTTKVKVTVN